MHLVLCAGACRNHYSRGHQCPLCGVAITEFFPVPRPRVVPGTAPAAPIELRALGDALLVDERAAPSGTADQSV